LIAPEQRDDYPKIATITHKGDKNGEDVTENGKEKIEQWVRKSDETMSSFNP
jgi:hypothetical protein